MSTSIKFHKNGTLQANTTFTDRKGKDTAVKYTGTYTIAKRVGRWRVAQCTISYKDRSVNQTSPWKRVILFHGSKNRFAIFESVQEAIADVQKPNADIMDAQQTNQDRRKAAAAVRPRQDTRYILLNCGDIGIHI